MKMLRWKWGVTRLDKIRNERIRGSTEVGEISKKVKERRIRWHGYVMRRDEEYVGKQKQKERKTEEDVGVLCERRSGREGTARRGGIRPSCMEATIVPYRPPHEGVFRIYKELIII